MSGVKEGSDEKVEEVAGLFDGLSVEDAEALFAREESGKLVELAKGEKIGYAEFGEPNGSPAIFLPGVGVGRMIGALFHQTAQKNNIRLISVDRPGIGLSSDHDEQPRTKEMCRRLRELAPLLGFKKFHVMGHSAGALYAMSASVFLKDMVQEPLILFAPFVSPTTFSGAKLTIRFAANYLPSSLINLGSRINNSMIGSFSSSIPTLMKAQMSEAEKKTVCNDGGEKVLELMVRTLGQGNSSGMPKDVLLCLDRNGGTGFNPDQLILKMLVLHGTQDDTVPLAAIKAFDAATGDNVSVHIIAKGTHNICLDPFAVQEAFTAIASNK